MKIKLTNMCMIEKDDMVLVQLREKKDWPGITFPGGKVEKQESIYASCIREVKEETGLDVKHLSFSGTIHYDVESVVSVAVDGIGEIFNGHKVQKIISDRIMQEMKARLTDIDIKIK